MQNIRENLIFEDSGFSVRCWLREGTISAQPLHAHWHDLTEIVCSLQGNGVQQVGKEFFILQQGEMSVIGSNQLHSYFAYSEGEEMRLLILQFDAEQILKRFGEADRFSRDWISGRLFFSGPVPVTPEIQGLLFRIYQEVQGKKEGYRQASEGALLQLMVLLFRMNPRRLIVREREAFPDEARAMLTETFDLISNHFGDEALSLEKAAAQSGLSVTHFCRLFQKITGMGFHEYLNRYRVSYAGKLLKAGKSISDTAFLCGFGSSSTLYRNFKKIYGISPCQFRKRY